MAKLILFRNIFDLSDMETADSAKGKSVAEVLSEMGADCGDYSAMAEVYNPDTGETEMCPIIDDTSGPLNLKVTVNGKDSSPDTRLSESDVAEVFVIPAKDAGHTWAVIGGVLAIVAGIAWAAFSGGTSLVAALTFGIPLIMGGVAAIAWGLIDPKDKNTNVAYEQKSMASISGSANQPLEDAFPIIIGRISCQPKAVGSLYNEFIIDMESMKTRFGSRQLATELLGIAYSPIFIKDIKFGELVAVQNKNNVLSGLLSHETVTGSGGERVAAYNGQPITFDGKESGYEVEPMWNSNRVRMEISQFGNHRTIYPFTVKQDNFTAPLIYCYDEEYRDVAGEKVISWMGREFPTGLRNSTIKFSDGVPYKVTVGIDFPSGLYRSHTTSAGTQVVTKIPMNLAIQWRPVFKYNEAGEQSPEGGAEAVYRESMDAQSDTYCEMHYRGWRNFTESPSGVPYVITYSGRPKTWYRVYSINGTPIKSNGWYWYYINNTGFEATGTMYRAAPEGDIGRDKRRNIFTKKFVTKSLSAEQVERLRAWTGKHGSQFAYDYYVKQKAQKLSSYVKYDESKSKYGISYTAIYKELPMAIQQVLDQIAGDLSWTSEDIDAAWVSSHPNESYQTDGENVSRNEVRLNKGLSAGTSEDCNPNWEGAECWSFGRASGGYKIAERDFQDPALVSTDISFSDFALVDAAKNEMRFEVSATLSKEDILDLIGRNPKSMVTGEQEDSPLTGKTDVEISGIEVRVLRLTPCYLEGKDGGLDYSYSDVVKWTYLKTYCIDKQKLTDDIDNLTETVETVDPGTGETESIKVSRIDCNPKTYRQSDTWLSWNVADYRSIPVSKEDMDKLTLLAMEAEADPLGQLESSFKKVSLTGYAITPALLNDWTRWWYTDGTDYWYRDGYESSGNRKVSLHPVYEPGNPLWIKSDADGFDSDAAVDAGNGYWYSVKDRPWEEEMFPKKIEPKSVLQLKSDADGSPVFNDLGEPVTETVRHGNTWIEYIRRLMSEHVDSAGRWIATDGFRDAFMNRNAISQALGFLVGQSLGRESYWYNSLPQQRFVRYWKAVDTGEDAGFWMTDTDLIEHDGSVDFATAEWERSTEEAWRSAERTELGNGMSYSMRRPGSAFNMLTVKDALRYTDAIDIGGSYGPMPYRCNMYITSQQKTQQILQTILICGRAFWIYDELGRFEFFNDKERKTPVLMLTDENIISSSYTRSFKKGIAGYHGTFQDENNDFRQGEVYCLREGQSRDFHTRDIVDMNLQGVTDPKQFWCILAYMLGLSVTQRESWELKLTHVGNTLAVGSMVEFQSSVLEIGTDTSGRIARVITDGNYIYGFITDRTYEYREEYDEDGRNVQGLSVFQARAKSHSKVVTVRFASRLQQESGITVGNETYSNMKGQTNLVLLEKRISIEDETLDGEPDEQDAMFTQYIPAEGDIVAFGNVGMTTQRGVVYQLQYDEKQKVSASLYPYFPEVYRAGDKMPVYRTGMTKRSRSQEIAISMEATRDDLMEATRELRSETASSISGLEDGSAGNIGNPNPVRSLSAKAEKDGVSVKWLQPDGGGLSNTISHYSIEISKDGGTTWSPSGKSSDLSYTHTFDRTTDGYPEAAAFATWKVRVTAVNVYGGESTKVVQPVNATGYGTWILPVPTVSTLHSSGRSPGRTFQATLEEPPNANGRILYGNIRWQVQVRRPRPSNPDEVISGTHYDDPGEWNCPATSSNPYGDDGNYRDVQGTSVECSGSYIQVLPLAGQPPEGSQQVENNVMRPTYYEFRFRAVSDAPSSKWSQWSSAVGFTATIADIYDFVRANKTVQQEVVESLSAISANLGEISQGSFNGSDTNFWTLSTKNNAQPSEEDPNNRAFQGAFMVGDGNQYFRSKPVVELRNGRYVVTGYELSLKASNISFSSSGDVELGDVDLKNGTYIYDERNPNIRLGLSANGISIQRKVNASGGWDSGNVRESGVVRLSTTTDSQGHVHTSFMVTDDPASVPEGIPVQGVTAYHMNGSVTDESGQDPASLGLDATKLTDGDSHIRSSFGRGSYRGDVTVASPGQSCVVLTRMDSIYVNGYRVGADGTTELKDTERAAMWNEKAQTDSEHLGLTQAQYESNIFRTEAQNG